MTVFGIFLDANLFLILLKNVKKNLTETPLSLAEGPKSKTFGREMVVYFFIRKW